MSHEYAAHVRWSDVDGYGHVNNVQFLEFIQEARIDFLRRAIDDDDMGVVAARISAQYRRPMRYRPEPYVIHTDVVAVGRSSYTLASSIRDDDEVVATATVVLVSIDTETGRPWPTPEPLRALLEERLVEVAP